MADDIGHRPGARSRREDHERRAGGPDGPNDRGSHDTSPGSCGVCPTLCTTGDHRAPLRGGAAVARLAHNQKVAGSSPAPATAEAAHTPPRGLARHRGLNGAIRSNPFQLGAARAAPSDQNQRPWPWSGSLPERCGRANAEGCADGAGSDGAAGGEEHGGGGRAGPCHARLGVCGVPGRGPVVGRDGRAAAPGQLRRVRGRGRDAHPHRAGHGRGRVRRACGVRRVRDQVQPAHPRVPCLRGPRAGDGGGAGRSIRRSRCSTRCSASREQNRSCGATGRRAAVKSGRCP